MKQAPWRRAPEPLLAQLTVPLTLPSPGSQPQYASYQCHGLVGERTHSVGRHLAHSEDIAQDICIQYQNALDTNQCPHRMLASQEMALSAVPQCRL